MRTYRYAIVSVFFIFCECGWVLSPIHNLLKNKNDNLQTKCTGEQTSCNGACAHLKTDVKNCGVCGHICQSYEICSQGTCHRPLPIILASEQHYPNGVVVDANFVYWSNDDGTINKVKQAGGIVTTLVSDQHISFPLGIAVNNHFI